MYIFVHIWYTYHNSTQWASSTAHATTFFWNFLLLLSSRPSLLSSASGCANRISISSFNMFETFVDCMLDFSLSNKLSCLSLGIRNTPAVTLLSSKILSWSSIIEFKGHTTMTMLLSAFTGKNLGRSWTSIDFPKPVGKTVRTPLPRNNHLEWF